MVGVGAFGTLFRNFGTSVENVTAPYVERAQSFYNPSDCWDQDLSAPEEKVWSETCIYRKEEGEVMVFLSSNNEEESFFSF